jgi:hypothetical protein
MTVLKASSRGGRSRKGPFAFELSPVIDCPAMLNAATRSRRAASRCSSTRPWPLGGATQTSRKRYFISPICGAGIVGRRCCRRPPRWRRRLLCGVQGRLSRMRGAPLAAAAIGVDPRAGVGSVQDHLRDAVSPRKHAPKARPQLQAGLRSSGIASQYTRSFGGIERTSFESVCKCTGL